MTDGDIERLIADIELPLNLEMAATDEMLGIALRHCPHAACIVPERRQERTTEGGLDVAGGRDRLVRFVDALSAKGIRVSLFIEPEARQIEAAAAIGAPVVELHTGAYCEAGAGDAPAQLARLEAAAAAAAALGLECHAGHGIAFDSVGPIARIPTLAELNIGHFLIGEAIFDGLDRAIRRMRELMDAARRDERASAPA